MPKIINITSYGYINANNFFLYNVNLKIKRIFIYMAYRFLGFQSKSNDENRLLKFFIYGLL
jgi:hypothetical protein